LIGDLALALQQTTAPEDIYDFVAKDGDGIVGAILFTRLTFETPVNAFILGPVAVATACQRQGVGQRLIRFGLDHLKGEGVELAFTYGDPNYYSKVGFAPISEEIAKAPLPLSHPEGWLAQALSGDSIQPVAGESACVKALNDPRYW
jgi:putative acetyltransferase